MGESVDEYFIEARGREKRENGMGRRLWRGNQKQGYHLTCKGIKLFKTKKTKKGS